MNSANLTSVDLRDANLTEATLIATNLTKATLTGANLTGAIQIGANLNNARLQGADLTGAILIDTNLVGADLRYAKFDNKTVLPDSGFDNQNETYTNYWTPETDMTRYTNSDHPEFWQPKWAALGFSSYDEWI